MKKALLLVTGALILAGWGCSPEDVSNNEDAGISCVADTIICDGNVAQYCNSEGNGWTKTESCTGDTPQCSVGFGCTGCVPNNKYCDDNDIKVCNEQGTGWDLLETCPEDEPCKSGVCYNPCNQAAVEKSYEGCDYYAVTLMNSQLYSGFTPAVVISSRQTEPVEVTVTKGAQQIAQVTVQPDSTEVVELPWVSELKQTFSIHDDEKSVYVPNGAYHVVSSLPVTVYQFNPFRYMLSQDCPDSIVSDTVDGKCFSFTNDASLLLPTQVLTEHYIVMTRANSGMHVQTSLADVYSIFPSVLTIVNPNNSEVNVDIKFSTSTQSGDGVDAYNAGETGTFTIAAGAVLQFAAKIPSQCSYNNTDTEQSCDGTVTYGFCNMDTYDFTGTEIEAESPVVVFGAHNCAFIPYNKWACDHLEEQLFPYETWGKHFVVSQSYREHDEPDFWRILSGTDNNEITFTPSSVHASVKLNRGQFIEFEAVGAFEINSQSPILVGQFIAGQLYTVPMDCTGETENPPGDPSFSLAVPVEQYRTSYNFLTPETYDRSFINITTTQDGIESLGLDGTSLAQENWEAISETNYYMLRYEIQGGSHIISSESSIQFGIIVYGYGQYTSYMYPGGLDLELISVW